MSISKEALCLINHCYKDGKPVSCSPLFNMKYEINGIPLKFTEKLLEEIKASEMVKVSNQTEKQVCLCGIDGMKI